MRKGGRTEFLFTINLLKTKHNSKVNSKDSLKARVLLKCCFHTSLVAVKLSTNLLESTLTKATKSHIYVPMF
jgi:hypothetical protein